MELKKTAQYMLCQNDNCKNASNCLHYICWKHFSADQRHIWVLNPLLYPSSDEECPEFKRAEKIRLAWGIRNMLADIPYAKALLIKRKMISYFGRTKFYRIYREEKPVSPKGQKAIKEIFINNNIEIEPHYDRFTEEYDW